MQQFIRTIQSQIPIQQIITDELMRYAYATDASLYRMLPELVIIVQDEKEVRYIVETANKYKISLTFRAAGTSLSGQAVTNSVLVVLATGSWQNFTILDNGAQITLEPGIIGQQANNYLLSYKRKIGPDPGSISAAKIGGIIANNSSGMCCGTSKNSYATLVNIRAILANGSEFDTTSQDKINQFSVNNPQFIQKINQLRNKILQHAQLTKFIRKKFAIKNTSGYSLNAFLDHDDPIKIIERLLIGSEGTLGFVSRVTLNTIVDEEYKAVNLIYGNMTDLCNLTIAIAPYDISSIELLDYASIESIRHIAALQPYLIDLDTGNAAILIEITAATEQDLTDKLAIVNQHINNYPIQYQTKFTTDKPTIDILWQARKGVLPTIAGARPKGTSTLIEDVAVTIDQLPFLITDLQQIFAKYNYSNAAIFGHVLSGNVHFVITPNFSITEEIQAYEKFMVDFTSLVVNKYNGSLKAEHGSGRNISPFARLEWSEECWNIMWEIKELFDPQNILNPDVKLTRDNNLHMQYLKKMPLVDSEIDQCMECGFCEPVCPSRKFSLTPRQRNSVARTISTLTGEQRDRWQKKFDYVGIETCATTSMCKTVCPVGIDTGKFILGQKPQQNKVINHKEEISALRTRLNRANRIASIVGRENLQNVTLFMHRKFKSIPIYLDTMPKAQQVNYTSKNTENKETVWLLPSCPNRIFAHGNNPQQDIYQELLAQMGYIIKHPDNWQNSCCGQMYHSQVNSLTQQLVQNNLQKSITKLDTVLIDNSSCANFAKTNGFNTLDINKFIAMNIDINKLSAKYNKLAVHFDCSTSKSGLTNSYIPILQKCAAKLLIPDGIKCCGFAGDKGFSTPELNASSLDNLATQIHDCQIGVSFNRSCQIGLSHHGKIEYISFAELILQCLN